MPEANCPAIPRAEHQARWREIQETRLQFQASQTPTTKAHRQGGSNRFKRDVTAFSPTAMTVNFGMNDCGGPGSNFNEGQYKNFTGSTASR